MAGRIRMTWPQFLRRECVFNDRLITLTGREVQFLLFLLLNRGRHVHKISLIEMVYTEEEIERLADTDSPTKMADVYICRLRTKMPGLIDTERASYGGYGALRGGYMVPADDGPFEPLVRSETRMTPEQRLLAALRA